jgi:hypothetical protein
MILDGIKLKPNDTVYSLYRGTGSVQSITATDALVKFGAAVLLISAANITENGKKIIGLSEPLVIWRKPGHTRDVSAYLPVFEALEKI